MWDVRACRGCLAVDVKLEKITDAQKQIFSAVTDLKIIHCDGYPTYFCVECGTILKKMQAFRRRCKRAYYIMKEIMIVRKEVTYSDILLVDRNKTNLKSSLGLWNRNRTACYSTQDIDQSDITLELSLTQPETKDGGKGNKYVTKLVKYEALQNSMSVQHIIDIKPDKIEERRQLEIEELIQDIHKENTDDDCMNLIDVDDNLRSENLNDENADSNSANVNTNVEDIDMEDIFKGLNLDEENDDEDDWLPADNVPPFCPGLEKKEKPKIESGYAKEEKEKNLTFNGIMAKTLAKMLMNTDMRVLTLKEQREVRHKLLSSESYILSKLKCSVCIKTFTCKDNLLHHLNVHNSNSKESTYICQICNDKYTTPEHLKRHMHRQHMYEYKCKLCNAIEPTLLSLYDHFQNLHKSQMKFYQLHVHYEIIKLKSDELHETTKSEFGLKYKFACPVCNYGFENHSAYRDHLNRHQDIPSFGEKLGMVKCHICQLYVKKKGLNYHMSHFHNNKYKCKKCDRVLYSRKHAVDHLQEHDASEYTENENYRWSCPDCDKVLITPYMIQAHILKHTKPPANSNQVFCNQCGTGFTTNYYLHKHQLLQHQFISIAGSIAGDPENNCSKCDIQFCDKRSYIMHLMYTLHEEVNTIENICIVCKEIFDNKEDYLKHTNNCKLKGKYPRQCNYCDYIITAPQYRLKHFHREHPDLDFRHVDAVICELCGKSVPRSRLSAHKNHHEMVEAKYLECNYCSVNFETPTQYTRHVINAHTPKPFYCTVCHYSYKLRNYCREHFLAVHTEIKPFRCDVCDKRYGTLERLNVHYKNVHKINFRLYNPELYKSYTPGRTERHKIAVYPLMKIDASLIRKDILEKTKVELYDYMNRNGTPVEYKDYLSTEPLETKPLVKSITKKSVKRKHDSNDEAPIQILNNERVDYKIDLNFTKEDTGTAYDIEVENATRNILTEENDDACIDNNDNIYDNTEETVVINMDSSARVRKVEDHLPKSVSSKKLMKEYNKILQENNTISGNPLLKSESTVYNKETALEHTSNRTESKTKVRKLDDIQKSVKHQLTNDHKIIIHENKVIKIIPNLICKNKASDEGNATEKQVSGKKNVDKLQNLQKNKIIISPTPTFKIKTTDNHEEITVQHTLSKNRNASKDKNADIKIQSPLKQCNTILQENKIIVPLNPALKSKTFFKVFENKTPVTKNISFEIKVPEECQEEENVRDNTIVTEYKGDSVIYEDTLVHEDSVLYEDTVVDEDSLVYEDTVVDEDSLVYEDTVVDEDSVVYEDSEVLHEDSVLREDSVAHEEVVIDEDFQIIEMNNEQYAVINNILYKVEIDKDSKE